MKWLAASSSEFNLSWENPRCSWKPDIYYHYLLFTTACHLSLCWAKWIHNTLSHPTFLTSILILSVNLCLNLPNSLSLSHACFLTKCNVRSNACNMSCPSQALWFYKPKKVWIEVAIIKPAMVWKILKNNLLLTDVAATKHVRQHVRAYNNKLFNNLDSALDLQYKCWYSKRDLRMSAELLLGGGLLV